MASSCWWKVCHWQLGCWFHPFFWTWTIVQNTYYSGRAWWLPLVDERFVIDSFVVISICFFGLGVTIKAAMPNCVLPIADDGSLYKNCSSGKLIIMKNQWNTVLMEASVVSIMQTPAIPLWFPKKWLLLRISFLFSIDQQLYSHNCFSKISTTFWVSRNWWIIVVFL